MGAIPVYVGTTHAVLPVLSLNPMKGFIREFVSKSLTEFEYDKQLHRYNFVCDYVLWEEDPGVLRIPITFLPKLELYLEMNGYRNVFNYVPIPVVTPRETTFKVKESWIPRPEQIPAIDFLVKDPKPRKGLNLITGFGKTSVSTYCASKIGLVTMIVMGSNLAQWLQSIAKQTDIDREFTYIDSKAYTDNYKWVRLINDQCKEKGSRIYLICGSESIFRLVKDKIHPEIFICSISTLRDFVNREQIYNTLPIDYNGFLKEYGVGIKIVDEAHQNFHVNNKIDLISNIKFNWYMTATFMKNGIQASRIFDIVYPTDMKFGDSKGKPHVNTTVYAFRGSVPAHFVKRKRGYSAVKYEQYLCKRPMHLKDFLENLVLMEVHVHFILKRNPGEKCIIFVATTQMALKIRDFLNQELKDKGVVAHEKVSGVPDDILNDPAVDIYIGTPLGIGTGRDIPHLRTGINYVSLDSKGLVKQMFGRLREIQNVTSEWVDNVDRMIDSQVRHFQTRDRFYESVAKDYKRIRIS